MKKRYTRYSEWNYRYEPFTEKCIIYPTKERDYCFDSYGSHDGFECEIYGSLEDAILKSGYNPEVIEFIDLSEEEIKLKDKILSEYTWDYYKGYTKKDN